MKKIISLLAVLFALVPSVVLAKEKKKLNADDLAEKIAYEIVEQIRCNKQQKTPYSKGHIIDINKLNFSGASQYDYFVNNGGTFWNLSQEDKNEIDAKVNNYSNLFEDIEYIIVIGSVFKFGDLEENIPDMDWDKLLKNKKVDLTLAKGKAEQEFMLRIMDKVEAYIGLNLPSNHKHLINWYLSIFKDNPATGKYTVETKSWLSDKSGYNNDKFGFKSLDGKLITLPVNSSKKDWIKRNVDFDANTISYIRDFETNVFFVNKSSQTFEGNQFLKDLFDGKKKETIGGQEYRNIKIILLMTDHFTSASDREQITSLTSKTRIVVHLDFVNNSVNKPKVSIKYPGPEVEKIFKDYIEAMFDTRTFWEKFGDELKGIFNEMLTVLYDVLDFIAKGLLKCKIPDRIWNCCAQDYQSGYADVFGVIMAPFDVLGSVLGATMGKENYNGCSFSFNRGRFAFFCGIWNGFVEVFAGIPTMLKLLISGGINQNSQVNADGKPFRNDWSLLGDQITKNGGGMGGFFKTIWISLKELHDPSQPCVFSHSIGSDVLMVIAAILTAGESLAGSAASTAARTLFITLERLDVVSRIIGKIGGTVAKYTVTPVIGAGVNAAKQTLTIVWKEVIVYTKPVFEIVAEGGRSVIRIYNKATNAIVDFTWQAAQTAKALIRKADGTYFELRLGFPNVDLPVNPGSFTDDLVRQQKMVNAEIKEILKDENGLPLVNEQGQGLAVVKKEGSTEEVMAVVDDVESLNNKGFNSLDDAGKFVDNALETDYQKYVARKAAQGKTPRSRLDWKQTRDYWKFDSPMARGNKFNEKAKAEGWYTFDEIHLENGKRLDSYTAPSPGNEGQIVSRKSTYLEEIDLSTFEDYLKEMKNKYSPGTRIRSDKYLDELDGKLLEGKMYLEIPDVNQSFDLIEQYKALARDKYGIELKFRPE